MYSFKQVLNLKAFGNKNHTEKKPFYIKQIIYESKDYGHFRNGLQICNLKGEETIFYLLDFVSYAFEDIF